MDWKTESDGLLAGEMIIFPYCIVEIKLREPFISSPPKWLGDLESSSLLHKENLFSKFIHATYALNKLSPNPVPLRKPYWWDLMEFTSPQMAIATEKQEDPLKYNDNKSILGNLFMVSLGLISSVGAAAPVSSESVRRLEPRIFFANERIFLTWITTALFICSIGIGIADTIKFTEGALLILSGIVVIIYGMVTFNMRMEALLVQEGFTDNIGPVVLTILIMVVFLVSLILI